MRAVIWLTVVLLFLSANAQATCDAKSPTQVMAVLKRGIELNERFKQAANASDETAYRALRAEVEAYDETLAIPCVRRAQLLLTKSSDAKLLNRLMAFIISHENAADESMSDAVAALYVKRPKDVETELRRFSSRQRTALLASIDAGWVGATGAISVSRRQDLLQRLNRLRETADNRKLDVRQ